MAATDPSWARQGYLPTYFCQLKYLLYQPLIGYMAVIQDLEKHMDLTPPNYEPHTDSFIRTGTNHDPSQIAASR
jgi:hypothetical protein